jgi:hypothetical protein
VAEAGVGAGGEGVLPAEDPAYLSAPLACQPIDVTSHLQGFVPCSPAPALTSSVGKMSWYPPIDCVFPIYIGVFYSSSRLFPAWDSSRRFVFFHASSATWPKYEVETHRVCDLEGDLMIQRSDSGRTGIPA